MTNKIISIAMIGVGPMAAQHAAALNEVPGINIVTCASRSQEKSDTFAAAHRIPEARLFDDVVREPNADALWVVAPCDVMAGLAVDLSKFGLPMFLEKPVGLSAAETERVASTVTVPNMVGLNRRFYEVIREGKRLMDEVGGVRAIEVHMPEDLSRVPSGAHAEATLDAWQYANTVHLVDLFRYFGGDIKSVVTSNVVKDRRNRSYSALIECNTGARGVFQSHWFAPGGWRVTVYGDGLTITYQPIEKALVQRFGNPSVTLEPMGPDARLKAGLFHQAEAFQELVRSGVLPEGASDLNDYLKSIQLIEMLTIKLDPILDLGINRI